MTSAGRTEAGIARKILLTDLTVKTHVSSIQAKLRVDDHDANHRRVLPVLTDLADRARA